MDEREVTVGVHRDMDCDICGYHFYGPHLMVYHDYDHMCVMCAYNIGLLDAETADRFESMERSGDILEAIE